MAQNLFVEVDFVGFPGVHCVGRDFELVHVNENWQVAAAAVVAAAVDLHCEVPDSELNRVLVVVVDD